MAMRVIATEGDVQIKEGDALVPLTAGQAINPGDQLAIGEDALMIVKENDGDLLFLYGGDLVVKDEFGASEIEPVNVEDLPFTTQPEAELVSIFDVNANLVLGKVFAGWNSITLERPIEETDEEDDDNNLIDDPAELAGSLIINSEGYEDLLPYNNLPGGLPDVGNILVPIQLNIQFSVADNEEVNGLLLQGFPPGSKMVVGSFNPSDPLAEVTEFTPTLDSINLTRGDIDAGVYFIPAHNDDTDVNFSYALTITDPDSGLTNTLSGTSLIIIDAVADIPNVYYGGQGPGQDEGEPVEPMFIEDGDNEVNEDPSETEDHSGVSIHLAEFGFLGELTDTDGSEVLSYQITLFGLPEGTTVTNNSGTYTLDEDTGEFIWNGDSLVDLPIIHLPADYSSKSTPLGDTTPLNGVFKVISTEQIIEGELGELDLDNNVAENSLDFNILVKPTIDVSAVTTKVTSTETDDNLPVNLTTSLRNTQVTDSDDSEVFTSMALTINNFPEGATINGNAVISSSVVAGTLTAQLDPDILQNDENAVIVTFPAHYSTQTPQPEGYLGIPEFYLTVETDEGSAPVQSNSSLICINHEEDLALVVENIMRTETNKASDPPLSIHLVEDISANADEDVDNSEYVDGVSVTLYDLPAGTIIEINGSVDTTLATDGAYTFTGSYSDYETLYVKLPQEFSTESRSDHSSTPITGTFSATTNEGGSDSEDFTIIVKEEKDLAIRVRTLRSNETDDNSSPDGGMVSFAPLGVTVTDPDGSEVLLKPYQSPIDNNFYEVKIVFSGLPTMTANDGEGNPRDGSGPYQVSFDQGSFDPNTGTWYGDASMLDNSMGPAVKMTYPNDWATGSENLFGFISAQTNEGTESTRRFRIEIKEIADPAEADPEQIVLESELDEQIDNGEVATIALTPNIVTTDDDGSEFIESVLIKGVPVGQIFGAVFLRQDPDVEDQGILVFKNAENNGGDITLNYLALPTNDNPAPWENLQLIGFPKHFSGVVHLEFIVTTTEFDTGVSRVTHLDYPVIIEPVVDPAQISGTVDICEDTTEIVDFTLFHSLTDKDNSEIMIDDMTEGTAKLENIPDYVTIQYLDPITNMMTDYVEGEQISVELLKNMKVSILVDHNNDDILDPEQDSTHRNEDFDIAVTITHEDALLNNDGTRGTPFPSQTETTTGNIHFNVIGVADDVTVSSHDEYSNYFTIFGFPLFPLPVVSLPGLGATTPDTDGSESLHYILSNVPPGVIFTDDLGGGINDIVGTYIGDGKWLFSAEEINDEIHAQNLLKSKHFDHPLQLTGISVENDADLADFDHKGINMDHKEFLLTIGKNKHGGGGNPHDNSNEFEIQFDLSTAAVYEDSGKAAVFNLIHVDNNDDLSNYGNVPALSVAISVKPGSQIVLTTADGTPIAGNGDVININPLTSEYIIDVEAYANYLNTVDSGARLGFLPGEDQASAPATYDPPIDPGDYTDTSTFLLEMHVTSHQINSDGTPYTSNTDSTNDIPIIPLSDAPILSVSSNGGIEDNSNDPTYVASFDGFKINFDALGLKDDDGSEEFIEVDGVSGMLIKAEIVEVAGELTGSVTEVPPNSGSGIYIIHDINDVYFKPTEHLSGDFDIEITVTSLDKAIDFYANPAEPLPDVSASTTKTVTVHVEAKADGPDMDVASGTTVYPDPIDEDDGSEIAVGSMYGIDLIDDDDSELMGITITADPGTDPLPDILIFNKGHFEGSTNSYTLTPDDYNMLTIQGAPDFSSMVNLTVEATTVEKSHGDIASDSFNISIEILPTEDIDIHSPGDITRNEARSGLILTNTIIPLDLLVTISDDDGSEVFTVPTSMTIDFNYIPDGATLDGGGTLIGNTWTGTNSELSGLSLNLAPGTTTEFDGAISVNLTAESNEGVDTSFYTVEVVGVDDAGPDKLVGDDNDNLIQGGGGNDEIEGGAGDDTIDGGTGTNYLEGNAGADTFIVFDQDLEHGAMNTIIDGDFDETEDILDLTDVLSFDIMNDDANMYIKFDSTSGDTKVTIDKGGNSDFDVNVNPNAYTAFVLEGVALNQGDVQTLVNNGHILVENT